jgi:TonB family protein
VTLQFRLQLRYDSTGDRADVQTLPGDRNGGISNLAAADLSGKWTGTMETNGSQVRIFVTLDKFLIACAGAQCAQAVSGTVATSDEAKTLPIEKDDIQGDTVSYHVHDNAGRIVKFRLSLTGSVLNGEAEVGGQVSKMSVSNPANVQVGFGSGDRAGSGVGSAEGVGSRVSRISGPVSSPVVIHKVDPEYSEEASSAKLQGTVVLYAEITPNGSATNIKVVRSLGMGLDEKAVEAVKQWDFKPGQKDGKPVTVAATIEVNFRL